MADRIYDVYMFGRKALCPVCAGMMIQVGKNNHLKCNDCDVALEILKEGLSESHVTCKQVMKG